MIKKHDIDKISKLNFSQSKTFEKSNINILQNRINLNNELL